MARAIIPVPALIVLGLWIVLQFFSGIGSIMSQTDEGGVAYMAHIGGFVAGFILTFLFRKRIAAVTSHD
jgi:membrane associated rhomboid family serine protease